MSAQLAQQSPRAGGRRGQGAYRRLCGRTRRRQKPPGRARDTPQQSSCYSRGEVVRRKLPSSPAGAVRVVAATYSSHGPSKRAAQSAGRVPPERDGDRVQARLSEGRVHERCAAPRSMQRDRSQGTATSQWSAIHGWTRAAAPQLAVVEWHGARLSAGHVWGKHGREAERPDSRARRNARKRNLWPRLRGEGRSATNQEARAALCACSERHKRVFWRVHQQVPEARQARAAKMRAEVVAVTKQTAGTHVVPAVSSCVWAHDFGLGNQWDRPVKGMQMN